MIGVHLSPTYTFSKHPVGVINLLEGLGVEGDAHCGVTVKHRSRVRADASQPNLRQVHLLQSELFRQLHSAGFSVTAGDLGENITTRGIDLLALPVGARLTIGDAVIVVTGLRNPCQQLNRFRAGLMQELVRPDGDGGVLRRAGVMGIVARSGAVRPGDRIRVDLPPPPHHALTRV